MTYKLTDIDLDEVSLVDEGAVPRKFLIIKRDMGKPITTEVKVEETKKEEPKINNVEKSRLSKPDREKLNRILTDIHSLVDEEKDGKKTEVEVKAEVKPADIDYSEIAKYVKEKVKELKEK